MSVAAGRPGLPGSSRGWESEGRGPSSLLTFPAAMLPPLPHRPPAGPGLPLSSGGFRGTPARPELPPHRLPAAPAVSFPTAAAQPWRAVSPLRRPWPHCALCAGGLRASEPLLLIKPFLAFSGLVSPLVFLTARCFVRSRLDPFHFEILSQYEVFRGVFFSPSDLATCAVQAVVARRPFAIGLLTSFSVLLLMLLPFVPSSKSVCTNIHS